MQKIFFEILVQTVLTVGLIWTILELTPKSALHYRPYLYFRMVPYQTDKRHFCFNLKMHSAKSLEQPSKKSLELKIITNA